MTKLYCAGICQFAHRTESCHTNGRVMSRIFKRHAAHNIEACHTYDKVILCRNMSRRTFEVRQHTQHTTSILTQHTATNPLQLTATCLHMLESCRTAGVRQCVLQCVLQWVIAQQVSVSSRVRSTEHICNVLLPRTATNLHLIESCFTESCHVAHGKSNFHATRACLTQETCTYICIYIHIYIYICIYIYI